MIAFVIQPGTQARAIRADRDWHPSNVKHFTTKHRQMFFAEDVVVDPVGHLGTNRSHTNAIGGDYARAGWYGFHSHEGHTHDEYDGIRRALCREGWVLLVPARDVITDNDDPRLQEVPDAV
jgi:hypothetical protein